MRGYIKIDRSIFEHITLQKRDRTFCEVGAFIWLLLEASFLPRKYRIANTEVQLQRGQLCCSVSYMARAFNWDKSKVQRWLERLKEHETITSEPPPDTPADIPNIITICHYDRYQDIPNDISNDNKQNKLKKNDKNYNGEFNKLWNKLSAKRGSKKLAYQKWLKIRNKVDESTLVTTYNNIVKKVSSIEFIPHFSTFISQERWLDEDKIVQQKQMTHADFFKARFPDKVEADYDMISYSYPEIVFVNKKGQRISFDMRDGRELGELL
tara:strand:- start:1264 stop:2064 length:801 start_codon:yes stop_codon:yes gene_type:complete